MLNLEVSHGGAKFIDANHNLNYGTFQPILFPGAYCLLMFVQPEVEGDFLKGYNRGELQMV